MINAENGTGFNLRFDPGTSNTYKNGFILFNFFNRISIHTATIPIDSTAVDVHIISRIFCCY